MASCVARPTALSVAIEGIVAQRVVRYEKRLQQDRFSIAATVRLHQRRRRGRPLRFGSGGSAGDVAARCGGGIAQRRPRQHGCWGRWIHCGSRCTGNGIPKRAQLILNLWMRFGRLFPAPPPPSSQQRRNERRPSVGRDTSLRVCTQ